MSPFPLSLGTRTRPQAVSSGCTVAPLHPARCDNVTDRFCNVFNMLFNMLAYVLFYVCVCVRVCDVMTYAYVYVYIYIYVCVCVEMPHMSQRLVCRNRLQQKRPLGL